MRRPAARGRQLLQLVLGLAISGVSIFLLLRRVDLHEVGAALSQARLPLLLLAAGMYFLSVTLRAWRWTVLLTPVRRLSLAQVWPVTVLGYAGNVLLPARLGELLRAAVLRTRDVPMSAGLATIAAERVVDGLATVALVLIAMRLLPEAAPQWLTTTGRIAGIVFGAGLVALWLVLSARSLVARLLDRLCEHFPLLTKPAAWALRFVDGLAVLRSPGLLLKTFGITALGWCASIMEYALVMAAIGVHLPLAGAAFSISAIGLSSAIPAGPGYVGTQELVGVTVLGLWGVDAATALAVSLAFHVVEIVPIAIVGLIVGWREGVLSRQVAGLKIAVEKSDAVPPLPSVAARGVDDSL